MNLSWWGWVVAIVVAIVTGIKYSINRYRDDLRREFLEYVRTRRPDIKVVRESRESVSLQNEDGSDIGVLYLHRIYQEASQIPNGDVSAKREVFQRLFKALEEGQNASSLDPERDRERVRLRLLPESRLRDLRQQTKVELPARPVVDGLFAVVVLDNENSVAYANADHLQELDLDLDAALALAVDNLAATFTADTVRTTLDKPTISVLKSMDTYDASRLLVVPRFLGEGESLAAMIPDRDTLVLAPLPADGDWSTLRKLARNNAGDPLWTKPLLVTPQGVSPAPE